MVSFSKKRYFSQSRVHNFLFVLLVVITGLSVAKGENPEQELYHSLLSDGYKAIELNYESVFPNEIPTNKFVGTGREVPAISLNLYENGKISAQMGEQTFSVGDMPEFCPAIEFVAHDLNRDGKDDMVVHTYGGGTGINSVFSYTLLLLSVKTDGYTVKSLESYLNLPSCFFFKGGTNYFADLQYHIGEENMDAKAYIKKMLPLN